MALLTPEPFESLQPPRRADEGEPGDFAWRSWWLGAALLAALFFAGVWWWQGATWGSFEAWFHVYDHLPRNDYYDKMEVARKAWYNAMLPESSIQPGRVAGLVLAWAIPLALLGFWRIRADHRPLSRRPELWMLAALLWQFIAMTAYGVAFEPSLVWWLERAAAFALTCALLWRWSADPVHGAARGVIACVVAGGVILVLDLLARCPFWYATTTVVAGQPQVAWNWGSNLGQLVGFGQGAPFGLPNFNTGAGVALLAVGIGWLIAGSRMRVNRHGLIAAGVVMLLAMAVSWELIAHGIFAPERADGWRVFALLGISLLFAGGLAISPLNMAIGLPIAVGVVASLVAALGIWAGTAHLATWMGLGAAIVAAVVLACPKHWWQTVVVITVTVGIVAGVISAGYAVSHDVPLWDLLKKAGKVKVLLPLAAAAFIAATALAVVLWRAARTDQPGGRTSFALAATATVVMGLATAVVTVKGASLERWLEPRLQIKESIIQRIFCTAQSYEAMTADPTHALIGYGTGATVEVLQQQPSYSGAWLAVPSYLEHAHNETWQVFLDGGLIGAGLLLSGMLLTIVPLWRRREQPLARALLCGWAALLFQGQFESHLSQPGPLLAVALLAGASWALVRLAVNAEVTESASTVKALPAGGSADATVSTVATVPGQPGFHRDRALTWGLAGIALLFALGETVNGLREMGPGGSPSAIVGRMTATYQLYGRDGDWNNAAETLKKLRQRVGPLDALPTREADMRILNNDPEPAVGLTLLQLRRFPIDASNYLNAAKLARYYNRREPAVSQELITAVRVAVAKAQHWLAFAPPLAKTADERARLRDVLALMGELNDRVEMQPRPKPVLPAPAPSSATSGGGISTATAASATPATVPP